MLESMRDESDDFGEALRSRLNECVGVRFPLSLASIFYLPWVGSRFHQQRRYHLSDLVK